MRRNSVSLVAQEKAHRVQVLAEIGRRMRDENNTAQRLPNRLADLVRKIDQLPERQFQQARRQLSAVQLADAYKTNPGG